jgi:A/G-specific adenine glycosylase
VARFRRAVRGHYRRHGRDLPWRRTRDPWCILVSEVMLQQTQVSRVIGHYEAFLQRFPDPAALARAPLGDALALWKGLGYNRRCLGLHRAASEIVARFGGRVPRVVEDLESLPGVGRSTACAVAAFAFGAPTAFIETNIRRVFIHWFFPGRKSVNDREILPLVERTMERGRAGEWYNALMDYGTWLAGRVVNPNRCSAHHVRQTAFEGSRRQLRGKTLALLVDGQPRRIATLAGELETTEARLESILRELEAEGFLDRSRGCYRVR